MKSAQIGSGVNGMRTIPTVLIGAAIAVGITGGVRAFALAQGPAAAGPLKLSDHVTVVLEGQPGALSNVGIVVGTRGTLVIDSGLGPRNGAILANVARQLSPGRTTLYVAATHFHPEHMMGESGFPASAIIVRSRGQQQDIDATGAAEGRGVVAFFKGRPERAADMEGAIYRTPDVTFAGDALIDLGGTRVQLMELGPAHTRGDVGFFVEGDAVVFSGDVAMSTPLAINASRFTAAPSNARLWLASLERLMAFKPRHVVPAHGPLGDASMIEKHRVFMTAVRDRVSTLKGKGQTADQIASTVTTELAAKYQVPEKIVAEAARLFYVELP
jgi:glyoxylase-like metal-dependent hydrolase (beta-lactamase superfamily II)